MKAKVCDVFPFSLTQAQKLGFFLLNVHAQAEFWLHSYAAECEYS